MRKTLLSTLALALLLAGAAPRAFAADYKPVVVVCFAGYQRLIDDVSFVGRLSDSPDLAQKIEQTLNFFTQGQGLAGLDKTKPWGAAVLTDGGDAQVVGYVPVTDLKKLLDAIGGLIGEANLQDGVYQLPVASPVVQMLYIKQEGGYAMIGPSAKSLELAPKDPSKLIGGLEKTYDMSVRLNVQNIPVIYRQMAIDWIKDQMEKSNFQRPGESDEVYEARSKITQQQLEVTATSINDLDEVTFGFAIDESGRRSYFDTSATAVAGTQTAKQMVTGPLPPSKFAGFLLPNSVANLHVNGKYNEQSTQQTLTMLGSLRTQIMSEIDDEHDFGDAKIRGTVKDIVGQILDVLTDTVKQGTMNSGVVVVGNGPFTLVAGGMAADTSKLDGVVKKLPDLLKDQKGLPADALKLNADSYKGLTLHRLTVDLSDEEGEDAANVRKLIGDKLIVNFGIGKQSVFIAVGEQGVDTIKKVIDKSEGVTEPGSKPLEFTLRLGPVLKFISEIDDANPIVGTLAASLQESGKDRVQISLSSIDNGETFRFEAEEGVLKLIGAAVKMAAGQGAVGAF